MTSSYSLPAPCQWFVRLAAAPDRRSSPRLALLLLGAVLARGRRTVTRNNKASRGADRRSRAEASRENHWHGAGVECEDVIGGRLRSGCQAVW